jgi:tripartite-type tricarboxylate transporter receptor subunit TctC
MVSICRCLAEGTAMDLPRRRFVHLAAGAAALPALSRMAWGQAWPSRFVRMVVPFAPGGGGDALARPLAQRLSEVWDSRW